MTTARPPRIAEAAPPRFAEWLLTRLLHRRDREVIQGDLLEEYRESVVPTVGAFRARLWYWRNVMSLIRTSRGRAMMWLAAGIAVAVSILVALVRNDFGPFLPLMLFAVIAIAVGGVSLTSVRSSSDAYDVWAVGRWWAFALVAVLLTRAGADAISSAADAMIRGTWLGASIATVFLLAGATGAYQSGKVRIGIVASLAASGVGCAAFFGVVRTISAFGIEVPINGAEAYAPGPWLVFASPEAWKAILVLLGISVVVGSVGAMVGRGWRGLSPHKPISIEA